MRLNTQITFKRSKVYRTEIKCQQNFAVFDCFCVFLIAFIFFHFLLFLPAEHHGHVLMCRKQRSDINFLCLIVWNSMESSAMKTSIKWYCPNKLDTKISAVQFSNLWSATLLKLMSGAFSPTAHTHTWYLCLKQILSTSTNAWIEKRINCVCSSTCMRMHELFAVQILGIRFWGI